MSTDHPVGGDGEVDGVEHGQRVRAVLCRQLPKQVHLGALHEYVHERDYIETLREVFMSMRATPETHHDIDIDLPSKDEGEQEQGHPGQDGDEGGGGEGHQGQQGRGEGRS